MASTLTTRACAGVVIALGLVAVYVVVWKKIRKGKAKDTRPPGNGVSTTLPVPNVVEDKQVETTGEGDASQRRKQDVGKPADTGQGTTEGYGNVSGVGDMASTTKPEEDDYICENGVCRLAKGQGEGKSKPKVRFDPLAESVTKSLSEFFENRGDSENFEGDESINEKIQKSEATETNAETDRKEEIISNTETSSVKHTKQLKSIEDEIIEPVFTGKSECKKTAANSSGVNTVSSDGEPVVTLTEQDQRLENTTQEQGQVSVDTKSESTLLENCKSIVEEEDTWEVDRYNEDDMTTAILVSQNSPGILSSSNAEVLVALLSHPDMKLRQAALNGIKKSSTFTRNQNLFREHGCLEKLSRLLKSQSMSLRLGDKSSKEVVSSVATAITNLSANTENHKKFEGCVPTLVELALQDLTGLEHDCVPTLVDLTLEDETGESVCLSSLQALTNLSLTDQYHQHYTRLVQKLYDLLDTDQHSIQLQALKILVNLSCSTEMVPHILAAKAPTCLLELLKQGSDEALTLRLTTFLANILQTVRDEKLSVSSLPPDDKAPSPETMYAALYGVNNLGPIKSKVFLLCRHRNDEIKAQATRLYHCIAK